MPGSKKDINRPILRCHIELIDAARVLVFPCPGSPVIAVYANESHPRPILLNLSDNAVTYNVGEAPFRSHSPNPICLLFSELPIQVAEIPLEMKTVSGSSEASRVCALPIEKVKEL
jgi:hypothetical protein